MTKKCRRCGKQHDGTLMRTDPRYTRVTALLAEVPRDDEGNIAFCRRCQRSVYFANGVVPLLINDLRHA